MSDKKVTIGIETTADTSGVKKADDSIVDLNRNTKKLDQELGRTGNTSEGVASKLGGNLRGKIQQAGYQVQDFAVQVGGGTSAMTAFGQQAPQFLGAFGPAGSIAGAIIAIGAVAYNVFSKMGDDAQSTTEKLEDMNDAIEKIAKNKTDDLNQEFADTAAAFDLATRRAAALNTGTEEVIKSQNKLALAQLESKALARESATAAANLKLAEEGKSPDTARVTNDAALRVQERAAQLARQGVAAEANRVITAQQAAELKAAELKAAEAAQQKALDLLAAERERLSIIRQQNEELAKIAKQRETDDPGLQIAGSVFPNLIPRTPAAIDAQKKLDDPAAKASQAVVESRIAALEKLVTGDDAGLNKSVATLSVELLAAQTNVSNLVQAAKNNTAAIKLDLGGVTQTSQTGAANKNLDAEKSTVVSQLDSLVSSIGDKGGKDLAPFITEMKDILQDKALSADELARLPVLMAQYFGKIANLGQAQNQVVRDAMAKVDDLEREVRNLKISGGSRNP